MRILMLSPVCPWPADEGGKMRIMGILGELAKHHEVSLLTTIRVPGDREGVARLRGLCARVEAVELPWGGWRKPLNALLSCLSLSPYLAVIYRAAPLRRALEDMAPGHDAIHGVYPYGAQLIENLGCLKVMDTQNVESDVLLGNARRSGNPLKRLYHYAQSRFMRRFELAVAARMDAVLACSDADRDFFATANPRAFTVPNAVDSVHGRDFPRGKDVVFTGLMSYLANADGVRWFVREAWPRVKAAQPSARLWIVGKDPGPEIAALAGPDVKVTGRVDDVSGFLRQARVFICPLRVGSGTRLKILEAFSWGVPVVSTGLGCSGIEAVPGEHLLVADAPEAFADAVLAVLGDDPLARRLGEAGRELAASRYTWEGVVKDLNEKVYRPCA